MKKEIMKFERGGSKPEIYVRKDLPKLFFTPDALATMGVYVQETSTEVGWLGLVDPTEDGDFVCREVFLLKQEVHGATTEITPEGLAELGNELDKAGRFSDIDRLALWGHSHVNMGVSPSAQDESQIDLFEENDMAFFFRIIANKKGDLDVTYYDFETGIQVSHLDWEVYAPCRVNFEGIKAELAEKVKEKTTQVAAGFNYYGRKYGGSQLGIVDYLGYDGYGDLVESSVAQVPKPNTHEITTLYDDTPEPLLNSVDNLSNKDAEELGLELVVEGITEHDWKKGADGTEMYWLAAEIADRYNLTTIALLNYLKEPTKFKKHKIIWGEMQ